jgi:hypothetical protein
MKSLLGRYLTILPFLSKGLAFYKASTRAGILFTSRYNLAASPSRSVASISSLQSHKKSHDPMDEVSKSQAAASTDPGTNFPNIQ